MDFRRENFRRSYRNNVISIHPPTTDRRQKRKMAVENVDAQSRTGTACIVFDVHAGFDGSTQGVGRMLLYGKRFPRLRT